MRHARVAARAAFEVGRSRGRGVRGCLRPDVLAVVGVEVELLLTDLEQRHFKVRLECALVCVEHLLAVGRALVPRAADFWSVGRAVDSRSSRSSKALERSSTFGRAVAEINSETAPSQYRENVLRTPHRTKTQHYPR